MAKTISVMRASCFEIFVKQFKLHKIIIQTAIAPFHGMHAKILTQFLIRSFRSRSELQNEMILNRVCLNIFQANRWLVEKKAVEKQLQ